MVLNVLTKYTFNFNCCGKVVLVAFELQSVHHGFFSVLLLIIDMFIEKWACFGSFQ